MHQISIIEQDRISRRADRSVASFAGTVDRGGAEGRVKIKLKVSDAGGRDVRVEKGILSLPAAMAEKVFAAAAAEAERIARAQQELREAQDTKYGHILRRLQPLEGAVSEKQGTYAEKCRRSEVIELADRFGHPDSPESVAVLHEEIVAETSAHFWLDARVHDVLVARTRARKPA